MVVNRVRAYSFSSKADPGSVIRAIDALAIGPILVSVEEDRATAPLKTAKKQHKNGAGRWAGRLVYRESGRERRIDVKASLNKLGITKEELYSKSFPQNSPEYALKVAIRHRRKGGSK